MKSAPVTDHSFPRTVFIGSEPLLAAWSACAGETTSVIPVALTDLAAAIDTIGTALPDVVVVEQAVAASGSGATLMDRLHNERFLRGIEVRLLSADRAADVMSSGPGDLHPQTWLNALAHPLPPRPERRSARVRATADEQAFIDGQPVTLIDLSAVGAQDDRTPSSSRGSAFGWCCRLNAARSRRSPWWRGPRSRSGRRQRIAPASPSHERFPSPPERKPLRLRRPRLRVTAAGMPGLTASAHLQQGETCHHDHREK